VAESRYPAGVTQRPPAGLVLFDCDGVLVDSERLQTEVMLEAAASVGFAMGLDEAVRRFRGQKMSECVTVIEAQIGRPVPASFVPDIRERTARAFADRLRPIPGVAAALARMGGPRCVASNGPIEKMRLSLRVTGLARFFDDRLYSAYDVGSWKPAPGLFLYAAEALRVPAAACVVVEDSVPGVTVGVAAGMRVLGYAPDGGGDLAAAGAEVFASMDALPGLVG